jgi:ATP-binding cassette subfamily B protein
MFKLFKNLKPMAILVFIVIVLVAGQAVAELFLPERMSEIINDGIFLAYEPMYLHAEMERPHSIRGVDSQQTLKGFDSDYIPIFEMVDGFSTYALSEALRSIGAIYAGTVRFRDIPVKDSYELFVNVIDPFLEGLKPYQRLFHQRGSTFWGYTPQEQMAIEAVINQLIDFNSLPVESETHLSVNSLLDQDPDADEDAMENEANRQIITACLLSMKRSAHGNIMPIPLCRFAWADGGREVRIATDEFGQAYEQGRIAFVYYVTDDGDKILDPRDRRVETGRPLPMPDYEVIMGTNSLAFAYQYRGEKWISHTLGITDARAQELANDYNANLIRAAILTDRGFDWEKEWELSRKITTIARNFQSQDDLIVLERILSASSYSLARTERLINRYYGDGTREGTNVTGFDRFFIRLGNFLRLSPAGDTARENARARELRTANQMMLPDGETIQTYDLGYILSRGGYMLLFTVAACVAAILAAMLSAKIAAQFSATIRSKVFRKVETFSLNEFDKFSTASLITRSTNDINQIQSVFLLILRTALIAPFTIIVGFTLAAQKSVAMTIAILYSVPILVVACFVAIKIVFPLFQKIQTQVDRITLIMREGLTGIRVVRAFNQQGRERARFQEVNEKVTALNIKITKYIAILAPLIAVVMNITMVGIIWIASNQIAFGRDGVNVGDMMAVIQYVQQIMMALVMLATVFVMFPRASASALRVNEVLATELSILDNTDEAPDYPERGTVRFENVNFKYSQTAENYILSDISFYAEKGKVTAIIGGTGSGKSSVINLIPRFYDIQEGEIYINGVPIKDIPQPELRNRMGFIPQKNVLFSGTIRSNLLYGKEDATEEEMWEALEIAQSAKFVKDKEGGLDSKVEQGGRNFSGGQKQRLSIARAIIRKPEILVFDDSFSALDFRTDKLLRTALKKITKESATIIVAQRVGTIMDADNIIVLDNGRIVGQGTHENLVRNCEVYKEIALSQMSEEELGL